VSSRPITKILAAIELSYCDFYGKLFVPGSAGLESVPSSPMPPSIFFIFFFQILSAKESENDFPIDFLDALTHDRMEVPMVLPCGQIIDRKTLEIYNQEEAKWGR